MSGDTSLGQTVECKCEEWEMYSIKIFDAQIYYTMRTGIKFNGTLWRYCPWCGKGLESIDEVQQA
jgi:hypothetical protein